MTQEKIRSLFHYDKETGQFIRIKTTSSRGIKGKVVGSLKIGGYLSVSIKKKEYYLHRLAWLYMTGSFPKHQIDHINHIPSDNRWSNLREVTDLENRRNQKKPKTNKSGVVGVHWVTSTNSWNAVINVESKRIHLGAFVEFSDAVNARKNAEVLYGFHENHGKD